MGHGGTHVPPSTSNNFIFSSIWDKSEGKLSNYSVVCEISWYICQQHTALCISTALVTKPLVIKQLLHPALKPAVSVQWHNFHLCPSSQQILATPLNIVLLVCVTRHFQDRHFSKEMIAYYYAFYCSICLSFISLFIDLESEINAFIHSFIHYQPKFRPVAESFAFVCHVVYLFVCLLVVPCRSHIFTSNLNQRSHTGRSQSHEELIRFSRSWDQRSRSRAEISVSLDLWSISCFYFVLPPQNGVVMFPAASVHMSVCLCVCNTITFESLDVDSSFFILKIHLQWYQSSLYTCDEYVYSPLRQDTPRNKYKKQIQKIHTICK